MKYRCVKCGHVVERLYIQYSPGNIRLVKCSNCMSVADEYIECELMILMIDLILHKPKAYRHLLFNLLHHKMLAINGLLLKSFFIFFILDAYKLWILNGNPQEWSIVSFGVRIFGHALLGNLVFLYSFYILSTKSLEFVEGFSSYKEVLLAIIVSCYLKVYMLAMMVWDFPSSVVYITDLFVMSSNLVALRVITKSSFERCIGVCLFAHALKFFVHWLLHGL
ncbi:protein ARV 2-like [Silene latifolia]|uniref:protein ARV 2-like n=1 Tax=Silene latifolia TaxID=37657 RepID=UPI003D786C64